ncbi:MAG: hypothetical protein EBR30_10150 [Cytophagia bacterium]|nr:hypothetical protein [Cytophagia bacterium]
MHRLYISLLAISIVFNNTETLLAQKNQIDIEYHGPLSRPFTQLQILQSVHEKGLSIPDDESMHTYKMDSVVFFLIFNALKGIKSNTTIGSTSESYILTMVINGKNEKYCVLPKNGVNYLKLIKEAVLGNSFADSEFFINDINLLISFSQ